MASKTVQIGEEAAKVLRELCARTGKRATVILRDALEEYRRKRFLEDANRAFAALKKDPKAWKAELKERKDWDATLSDGVEKR